MKKHVNQSQPYRIYDKQTKTWFEVTPEQYAEFDRWRTNKRKCEQYHGRCMCPRSKWWLCDGMCDDCEFHAPGDVLSLDKPVGNDDGEKVTLLDNLADTAPSIEEVICDKAELEQLFARLRELDPEADIIIQLWKDHPEGISDRAIARELGRPQKTFADQMKKYRTDLRRITGEK